jgi:hypothetical protein
MIKSDISINLYCTLDGYRVVAWSNGHMVFARTYALRQVALKACERLAKSQDSPPDGQDTGTESASKRPSNVL